MSEVGWTIDDAARQVAELLAPIGPIVVRPLLGMWGLYLEDRVVGIVHDGETYFRTVEATEARYLAAGSRPLLQQGLDGDSIQTPYHRVPDAVLADRDEACAWAYEAAAHADS
ncbi:MAG: hypothetical protein JWM98_1079 [Thermoleophilia bacterium]|nr:hypothetical protein [Thermoleophilia bacterium]